MRITIFTKQNGLPASSNARVEARVSVDSEGGPWATEIARNHALAESFASQDLERYLGIVSPVGRLFDRDTAPGAEPEEVVGREAPGRYYSRRRSVACPLPVLTTCASFCLNRIFGNVMPPEQRGTESV